MKERKGEPATGMIPINLNDLKAMRLAGKRFVRARWEPLKSDSGGRVWYQLFLHLESVEEPVQIVSARNRPRLWTRLPGMIEFLQEHFPEIEEVTLVLPKKDAQP